MNQQHLRTAMLLGEDGISRLSHCHVAVFGVGGVGSYTCEALARAGVGTLTIVDDDVVSVSNINRQLIALHSTVGRPKVAVMADRIRDINPDCQVRAMEARYSADSRELFFDRRYDFIADAIDSVSSKLDLIETALAYSIPIISSMGTGNKLDPAGFVITDISKTSGCPLARIMRRELRNRGIQHHTVLYSEESPKKPLPLDETLPGKYTVPGSVSWVPSAAGLMIAGHIIRQLLKTE